jgi:hypothetical protein
VSHYNDSTGLKDKSGKAIIDPDAAPVGIVSGLGGIEKKCHMDVHAVSTGHELCVLLSRIHLHTQPLSICLPAWSALWWNITKGVCVEVRQVEVRLIGRCPIAVPWHASANRHTLCQIDTRIQYLANTSKNTSPQSLLAA